MESLDTPNIFICKSNYIILAQLLHRLPSSSHPWAQSFGDHVDDPGRGLVIHRFFSRLGSSVGDGSSRWVPPKFVEIPSAYEGLDLILELDALLGVVAMAPMKSTVLSSVEALCLQRRRPSQIFFPFDLHQNLRTRSRERSIGVIPVTHQPRTSPSR